MPELPEVETIRRQLQASLAGREIQAVEVRDRMVFLGDERTLGGEIIERVNRAGKYLFVYFRSGRGLGIHLKMTGRMVLSQHPNSTTSQQNNLEFYNSAKHTRITATLKNGGKVYYWDTRRFGYWKVWDDVAQAEEKTKKVLGPDPWQADLGYLLGRFKKTIRSVKDVILDQSILAGVGNIYANDALWKAGIKPSKSASSLRKNEVVKLIKAIREVMERGLETGGASDSTYVNALGQKGSYQDEFLVYRRTGEPCHKCGNIIKRIVIGGRGSWYCDKCQK